MREGGMAAHFNMTGMKRDAPRTFNLFGLDPSHIFRIYPPLGMDIFIPLTLNQTLVEMGLPNPYPTLLLQPNTYL
jgi:hypothetical protein